MKQRDGYLYALDGIRALALLLIFNFHLWQQSWITYTFSIGNKVILNLEVWQRCGYVAIDMFFVISGFGLFYPKAREMFGEKERTSWKEFYKKRAKRILPGYYFMMLILLICPILSYGVNYNSISDVVKHYGLHALFLHIYDNSVSGSVISTAWTLGIEAAFYVVFPLMAESFKRKPVISFLTMFVIGQGTRLFIAANFDLSLRVMNFPLAYIDIFAVGMLSAYFTVYARHNIRMDKLKIFMTVLSILFICVIYYYAKWLFGLKSSEVDVSAYQRLLYRFILAWAAAGLIFSSVYSVNLWSKIILGNRIFRFLSGISYSFFLWHQNINIFLKRLNIPHSDMNPVMLDRKAMIGFSVLSFTLSLAIAIFSTYVIERMLGKNGHKFKNKKG